MSDYTPERQVPPEHYWSRTYNSKERICSFWHQLDEMLTLDAETVLEIGPGSGIVTDWLQRAGISVTTLDIDSALGAEVEASITERLPFEDNSFDAVLCCQVLEHIPFDEIGKALREIRRVSRLGTVISLPDSRPWFGISYPLYFGIYVNAVRGWIPARRFAGVRAVLRRKIRLRDYLFVRLIPLNWTRGGSVWEMKRPPIPHGQWRPDTGDEHYYEIGAENYPLERILNTFAEAGFEVERSFRVPENPWHHFFRLQPRA